MCSLPLRFFCHAISRTGASGWCSLAMFLSYFIFFHIVFDIFHSHVCNFVPHGSSAAVHYWSTLQKGRLIGHDAVECGTYQINEVAVQEVWKETSTGSGEVMLRRMWELVVSG